MQVRDPEILSFISIILSLPRKSNSETEEHWPEYLLIADGNIGL